MVLAAMVPLALGLAGDWCVVVHKVTGGSAVALVAATGLLVVGYGLWFGVTRYQRAHRRRRDRC
jgi:hypothetical protein